MSERTRRAPASRRGRKGAKAAGSQKPSPPSTSPPEVGSDDQIQQTLDEALANSFPASDPVSIVTSQHEEAWKKDRNRE